VNAPVVRSAFIFHENSKCNSLNQFAIHNRGQHSSPGTRFNQPRACGNANAPLPRKDGSLRSITQGAPPANVNSCWMPIPARAPPTLMLRPLFPWLAPARCLGHADAQASVPFATSRAHRAPSLARTPPFQSTRFDGSTLRARDVGGKASSPLRGSKKTTPALPRPASPTANVLPGRLVPRAGLRGFDRGLVTLAVQRGPPSSAALRCLLAGIFHPFCPDHDFGAVAHVDYGCC